MNTVSLIQESAISALADTGSIGNQTPALMQPARLLTAKIARLVGQEHANYAKMGTYGRMESVKTVTFTLKVSSAKLATLLILSAHSVLWATVCKTASASSVTEQRAMIAALRQGAATSASPATTLTT